MTLDANREQASLEYGRKERMLSRRAVVQARLKSLSETTNEETSLALAQISEDALTLQDGTSAILHDLSQKIEQDDGELLVSKTKAVAQIEAARQAEHSLRKAHLAEQSDLQNFVAAKKAEAAQHWADLQSFEDPTLLQKAIEQRMAAIEATSQTCQALAGKIWESVKDKELAYVRALQGHSFQLDSLLKMLRDQSVSFADASARHASWTESVYQKDFLTLIDQRREDLSSMLRKQKLEEQLVFEAHAEGLQSYHCQMEDIHRADIEAMRQLIVRMDGDFCDLQAKLESAKGAHLLNTDRLAYNKRALGELRPETQATLADQKRRIAFQKEHIAKLKHAFVRMRQQVTEENAKLSTEINKLTEDIDRQHKKYEGFIAGAEQTSLEVQTLKIIEKEAIVARIKDAASAIISDVHEGHQIESDLDIGLLSNCSSEDLWSVLQRSYQDSLQLHLTRTSIAHEVQVLQCSGLDNEKTVRPMYV